MNSRNPKPESAPLAETPLEIGELVQQDSGRGKTLVEQVEDSIRRGYRNATMIEWVYREHPATLIEEAGEDEPDPVASIVHSVDEFVKAGWTWTGADLTKDGWYIFYRSQGQLSPPIIQWKPVRG